MTANGSDAAFAEHMKRLETLVQELEHAGDPAAERTREIVQGLLEFHAAALARLMDHIADAGQAGEAVFDAIGRDPLVSSLLVLYGLHPFDVEMRVRLAIEGIAPTLAKRGGTVELLSVDATGGGVKVKIGGTTHCQSTRAGFRTSVEEAIATAAPEIAKIDIEDAEAVAGAAGGANGNGFVAAASVQLNGRPIAARKTEEACT